MPAHDAGGASPESEKRPRLCPPNSRLVDASILSREEIETLAGE